MSLKEQLAEYRAGWFKRAPAELQAVMQRHIEQPRDGLAKTALKAGDQAPPSRRAQTTNCRVANAEVP
jgi:hypothetical protein